MTTPIFWLLVLIGLVVLTFLDFFIQLGVFVFFVGVATVAVYGTLFLLHVVT